MSVPAAAPVFVMVAPNGARRGKGDHPALPVAAREIAREAQACLAAGAAAIHLHVRDGAGAHTLSPQAYGEAITHIRQAVGEDLVIQITTEAVGRYGPAEQRAVVRQVHPEAVSLALRELLPTGEMDKDTAAFFHWLRRERIWTQVILYAPEELQRFQALIEAGDIPFPLPSVLFVLGSYGGAAGHPDQLDAFLSVMRVPMAWSVCAFGPEEGACLRAAMARGGHGRTGFENTLTLADGRPARNNGELVAQAVRHAAALGRPLMTAADLRAASFWPGHP